VFAARLARTMTKRHGFSQAAADGSLCRKWIFVSLGLSGKPSGLA